MHRGFPQEASGLTTSAQRVFADYINDLRSLMLAIRRSSVRDDFIASREPSGCFKKKLNSPRAHEWQAVVSDGNDAGGTGGAGRPDDAGRCTFRMVLTMV